MATFLGNIRSLNPETFASSSETWEALEKAGATGGYAGYYGDNQSACDNLIKPAGERDFGDEEEHIRHHPKMVFNFVVEFPDQAAAATAYRADLFGQSGLRDDAFDVVEGDPTGFGPNAITSTSEGSPIQIRQAVWQQERFNIFFGSTALDLRESDLVTKAINRRAASTAGPG
jgi:hypothetical protein